jgi:GWxTD domain-containing protein
VSGFSSLIAVRHRRRCLIVLACLATACFPLASRAAAQKPKLPDAHQKWLDEDVVYIIAPLERDVFLKLRTDRERDLFIEAFWKHRDPTPETPLNEFKNEHYRRMSYADRNFGRSAPVPGWKTDRGRVYIILGEPNDVQKFEGKASLYPAEIWFYQNKDGLGLPAGFHLVFYQDGGLGDYKLYSPAKDGPQALMSGYFGDPLDYRKAYQALKEIEPNLADVSLSLIPGESASSSGRPTLASDMLIQKVENAPRSRLETTYAQKFLEYKDVVEVEYSTNYLDSESLVKLAKDPSGIYFVHYAIEPKKLSVNAVGDKYYTTIKLNGKAAALDGKTIYQFEKTASVNMDEARVKAVHLQPFDLHDLFPLIPGTYKLSILLKNEVSKEFSSLERTLVVPGESPALQMTSPILGYMVTNADGAKKAIKPFQFGGRQIYCQPNRVFTRNDTLAVAFQVFGLTPRQREEGRIKFVFQKNGQPDLAESRGVGEYGEFPDVLERFPLGKFVPAHYNLRVSVVAEERELIAATEEFDVSYLETVPRPWFYSKLMPDASDPVYAQIIGSQLFAAGRLDEARPYLEKALGQMPDSPDAALALARLCLALNDADKIPAILSRFVDPSRPPNYEIYFLAGRAHQIRGEFAMALDLFDRALTHFGVNTNLLNAVGECRLRLGRPAEALAAWENSLRIDPGQPDIQKKADALKEKK